MGVAALFALFSPNVGCARLNVAVLPPESKKSDRGETDQDRIRHAGLPAGILKAVKKLEVF